MSIYNKIWKLQKQVKGLKSDTQGGGYNNKFDYVSGNKILGIVKPIMNDLGLLLKQEIVNVDKEIIEYPIKNGNKKEMLYNVTFKFTWIDAETGESDTVMWHASGANGWDKGIGSAMTYAERYFLLKQLHVATDEDDLDYTENNKEEKNFVKKEEPKKEALKEIVNPEGWLRKHYKEPRVKAAVDNKLHSLGLAKVTHMSMEQTKELFNSLQQTH